MNSINQFIYVDTIFDVSIEFWIKYTVLLLIDQADKLALLFVDTKYDTYIYDITAHEIISNVVIAIELAKVVLEYIFDFKLFFDAVKYIVFFAFFVSKNT